MPIFDWVTMQWWDGSCQYLGHLTKDNLRVMNRSRGNWARESFRLLCSFQLVNTVIKVITWCNIKNKAKNHNLLAINARRGDLPSHHNSFFFFWWANKISMKSNLTTDLIHAISVNDDFPIFSLIINSQILPKATVWTKNATFCGFAHKIFPCEIQQWKGL